jgi:hypothetical protein
MPGLSSEVLRAGLALKVNQIKRASRSWLRDRTNQATGTFTSYAIAAGLYAAAGIFVLAACLVGAGALFRWVEFNYGLFWAFGATGGLLLIFAGICAAIAAAKLNRPAPHFPTLTSRLRVAVRAHPLKPNRIDSATDTATAILAAPASPVTRAGRRRPYTRRPLARDRRNIQAGLAIAAILLGWAVTRRQHQARRADF